MSWWSERVAWGLLRKGPSGGGVASPEGACGVAELQRRLCGYDCDEVEKLRASLSLRLSKLGIGESFWIVEFKETSQAVTHHLTC